MKRVLATAIVTISAVLAGCATNEQKAQDYIVIDGQRIPVTNNGEVELTRDQYDQLVGAKVIELTQDELRLVTSDRDVFEGVVEGNTSGRVTLLISKGSLKENFTSAIKAVAPAKVIWFAPLDFHLDEPIAIVAENLELAVAEALFDFPLSHTLAERDGEAVITVEAE